MSVNNNFANRIFLGGLPVSTTGSNIGDTGEVGEPPQSGVINSAWWSWTAPSTGTVSFDTIGSNFDTYLSLFSGSAVNMLTPIAADDDGAGYPWSRITRNVTAGTTYQIAVDGYQSYTGNINLNIGPPPPPNDNFVNQIALTGATANVTGTNSGATGEVGEPAQSGPLNSSWWSWTAPTTGLYNINTRGSGFDTYLSVFTGSALSTLTLIGADDDGGGSFASMVSLNATAGTTYRIAVDGYGSARGPIALNIGPPPPANDNFADRIALTGATATTTGTNSGATGELSEPAQSGPINSSWWSWTAPSTGTFTIDTRGSGSDTYLSLFTGSNLPTLALVEANDDEPGHGLTSRITRSFTAGTTYQIAVDGWSSTRGPIRLSVTPGTTGSAYAAAEITETANKGDGVKDPLTGTVADTLSLPFAESSVFPSVPVTDLTMGQEKDLLLDGGAAFDAPSLFSPVSTLVKDQSLVLMEPNGALAGNPALKINNDAFGLAQTSPLAEDPYLFGLSQAKPLGI